MPKTLQNSLTACGLAWRPVTGNHPNPVKGYVILAKRALVVLPSVKQNSKSAYSQIKQIQFVHMHIQVKLEKFEYRANVHLFQ